MEIATPSPNRGDAEDFLPEPRDIDVAGIKTRYYEYGSGPETVVLMYGGNFGNGSSAGTAFEWGRNIRVLGQRHRVIAFDKLGQGYTDPPLRDEDYTMAAVVQHAINFLEQLDLPPFHLVGHSRGGFASARITMQAPQLVKTLTVLGSGTLSPGVGLNEVVLANPPYPNGSREGARWVYQNYCGKPERLTEAWLDAMMDVMARPQYQAGVRKFEGEGLGVNLFVPHLTQMKRETHQWIREGRLQRPVQLIWGADDRTVQLERGLALYELVRASEPRTTFNVLGDAGHIMFREQSHQFNALMNRFIDTHRGQA